MEKITVKGAREHNLKNIDLEIPRDKLVVITGLSGSGKSSLAFDTIYAEGQRRYVESLSAYARQFLSLMGKPDVDYIEGLSPAISIEQRTSAKNPRSTVGTVTEIYDYLRLLFARIGVPHCWKCGRVISKQTAQQIVDNILRLPKGARIQVLAPLVRGRKGEYRELFEQVKRDGYVRVRVDGQVLTLDSEIKLERYKKHWIEVVVDRLVVESQISKRLTDSVETALALGEGLVLVNVAGREDLLFSERFACPDCGVSYEEIEPRMFSFNSPYGACPACDGLGISMEINPDLVVPDPDLSINQGAIAPWGAPEDRWFFHRLRRVARTYNIDFNLPFNKLTEIQKRAILYGSKDANFEGVIPNLQRRYRQTQSEAVREWIERFMTARTCPECQGSRLKPQSLAVKIQGKNIAEITAFSIKEALQFFSALRLSSKEMAIAYQILKEIKDRLGFLMNVGLDYLTLDRAAATLSGGEAERIKLATQIGSQLVGVLYILDEPSVGLHYRDNKRLLKTLCDLRDLGNTILVVEHDKDTIETADYVIDLGPRAGLQGGQVVATGSPVEICHNKSSLTGQYLSGKKQIPVPSQRRRGNGKWLSLLGAEGHNLKSIDVHIPLGTFTCVTGVSGSGKSTLVDETLYRVLAQKLYRSRAEPHKYKELRGSEAIDKVINIDQSPIGRTPRSNPATYTGVFTHIRELFSQVPEAKVAGYKPGRFSFNVKGGRCEACQGAGVIKIEMHFLPDVYVTCDACKGRRYNRETLSIRYKGKNIAEVLDMTVDEALKFFADIPRIKRKLKTLSDVGLGYIHLGQQATTLSGGEAQRVKLSTELSKVGTGKTLYILDEPTTGLHFEDVRVLLKVLNKLVDMGNTVLVIEHNMEVIKAADYIIDLGPEGGDQGGWVVAAGTPEEVAQVETSYTGNFLRKYITAYKTGA
ncbi:MAG: excinuclease ABC subunit UvrA [Candidatus Latescibacterota bacterium]|nr:MAG: excinuclease ABC subunit UvrA [Candidatus Latescibacterota bacterium]